jgi:hydroxyacylglutathione hydrolase
MIASVRAISAFQDNYIWAICFDNQCVVVDPGDAAPVLEFIDSNQFELIAILLTHHHADHIGGVNKLRNHFEIPVYGPISARIPQVSHSLAEGQQFSLWQKLSVQVMEVPGHTLDHIAYLIQAEHDMEPWLFCGDTLFAGGCGRIFEGNPHMMYTSLQRLALLPPETQVFCAHEYTINNLKFAEAAEPHNVDIGQRLKAEVQKRARQEPTLPSTLALEQQTNPFLRCQSDSLKKTVAERFDFHPANEVEVFTAIRRWKDEF